MSKDSRVRGLLSTEPQSRAVVAGIESRRAKTQPRPETSTRDTGGKTTAQTPKGVEKSKEMAEKDKERIRKAIDEKVRKAQEKEKERLRNKPTK